jgi:hypothetical protein
MVYSKRATGAKARKRATPWSAALPQKNHRRCTTNEKGAPDDEITAAGVFLMTARGWRQINNRLIVAMAAALAAAQTTPAEGTSE